MSKKIVINHCGECPHSRDMLKYMYCVNNNKCGLRGGYVKIDKILDIINQKIIPDWCPLEDD